MNDNIFLHFLYGPYLVVFKSNSLCKMGDYELYSKKPLANFWHFWRGLIRSVLIIKAYVNWGIMSHIVKLLHCKRMPTFSDIFYNGLIVVFKNNGLYKMGNNEQYSIKSLIANVWHFCGGLIVVFKKFSLYCLMADNKLYSRCLRLKMKATISVTFCRCLAWSFYEKQPVQDQG